MFSSISVKEKTCPTPTCPPGYRVVTKFSKNQQYYKFLATMFSTYSRRIKNKSSYLGLKNASNGIKGNNVLLYLWRS